MKKYLLLVAFLLVTYSVYAQDTNLGKISLTPKQLTQSESLKSDVIRGFSFWDDGSIVVVSTRVLSSGEIASLKADLASLPDEYTQEYYILNFDVQMFQSDLFSILGTLSNPDLRFEFGALNTFATNKDFTGMEQYLGFLVSVSAATQADVDAVNTLIVKQGVVV